MKTYIGTKIINAEPAMKSGVEGYQVVYPDGYISWSPAEAFEGAYREISSGEQALLKVGGEAKDAGVRANVGAVTQRKVVVAGEVKIVGDDQSEIAPDFKR